MLNFSSLLWFLLVVAAINCASLKKKPVLSEEALVWRQQGLDRLTKLIVKNHEKLAKAKNIIFFLGDGMGMTTVTAGRIYKGQQKGASGEESSLVFDDFPYTGLAKTYNTDKQVPDSAGTATAIFTGIKTGYGVIGMDDSKIPSDAKKGKVTSFMKWAQDIGKRTGIVTTTRITHATPAATYASVLDRNWECDSKIPEESANIYKDIARQLVEDEPGKNFNVIFGGGLSPMGKKNPNEQQTVKFEGETESVCERGDGKNLIGDWLRLDGKRKFVENREDLMNLSIKNQSHVMGIFRNNHITYAIAQQVGEPSLSEMTQQAIRLLGENDNGEGFVLMVEGGRIDQGHHQNYAHAALQEVVEFDAAIDTALRMTSVRDTLIIVTADHSHAMTLNGYPKRGNDILGFANKPSHGFVYETLSYANGPGFDDHRNRNTSGNLTGHAGTWIGLDQLTPEHRAAPTYRHLAAFPLKDETHGGEDVAVFASGPGSNLVRGVFEQNYLAYVMSYAGCMGPAADIDDTCERWSNGERATNQGLALKSFSVSVLLLTVIAVNFIG